MLSQQKHGEELTTRSDHLEKQLAGKKNETQPKNKKLILSWIHRFTLSRTEQEPSFCVTAGAEITASFEKKVQALRQDLDNIRKSEIGERENHWNSHIATLKQDHDETYRSAEEFVIIMKRDADTLTQLKVRAQTQLCLNL